MADALVLTNPTIPLKESLSYYFGFDTFKDNQESIIQSLLAGNNCMIIMPTGGGKSLCYQLPAIITQGTAIIISPLIALMKNQVDLIRGYSNNDNIAHFLNSSLNRQQIKQVKQDLLDGHTKMLYVAPETLTRPDTIDFFKQIKISFVAVDEAHCISEWGHDFRPEYRRIRTMVDTINHSVPIMALTATATPKVQEDIIKILQLEKAQIFASSFNRPNLYYEIRPKASKEDAYYQIVHFIKTKAVNKSGIIYCLNRKTTEEIAQTLQTNGIKAVAYHAGLAQTRAERQDQFLAEDVQVIVATIAFGMGIDKPDVRFVIHYNMPKSMENYYQETGRAGRDGLEGKCIGFFNYKDINKLEKFLRDKTVAEREIGGQQLAEVVAYCETASCRRQFLLHYFGENYPHSHCNCGCDNCTKPKEKVEAQNDIHLVLQAIQLLSENFDSKYIVRFLTGKKTTEILTFKHNELPLFAKGAHQEDNYWNTLIIQSLLHQFLKKDIEHYGTLKLLPKGNEFIQNPHSIKVALSHQFTEIAETIAENTQNAKIVVLDAPLFTTLQDLRRKVAKQKAVPTYVVFQDRSLEEMATYYPTQLTELENITGVSKGKAAKYGKEFVEYIAQYVKENNIERPTDFVVKSVANKSKDKVLIIQNIDKRVPFENIANGLNISQNELLAEIEKIADGGTRLNIKYQINTILDYDQQDEIYDYFMGSATDNIDEALKQLGDEYTEDDLRLMRIQFLSEVAH